MQLRSNAAAVGFFVAIGCGFAAADTQLTRNGSMESGAGASAIDPMIAASWTEFGANVERSAQYNLVPVGGGFSLKAFGDGTSSSVGATQEELGVSPGQSVTLSVSLFSPANDRLRGSGQAGIVLEFLGTFGNLISSQSVYVLDANSPSDTWIPATLGPFAAPASTARVRAVCRLQWNPGDVLGAAYWDNAVLTINGGPNRLENGDFEVAGNSPGQSPAGIDEWAGFNDQEKSSDVSRHGLASLKLGTREAYSGLYQDLGAVNDGDQIFLQAYVWNPSSDPLTANSRAGLKLEFEVNGNAPSPEENLAFTQNSPEDVWVPVVLNTTVPPLATIARVVFIFNGGSATTGEVNFDSVFAERGGQPAVNQLSNASFEDGSGGLNGLTSWTEFGNPGTIETQKFCPFPPGFAHEGFCTARSAGPGVTGVFQEIAVTPGESFSISTFIRTPASNPLTGPGTAGVKVEWFAGGVPADIDIGAPNASPNTIGPGAATNTWIPLTISYTMPPGSSAVARFVCIIEKGAALAGRTYFDTCEAVVFNRFDGSDVDADGDQDVRDFAALHRVFAPSTSPVLWPGVVFDRNDDDVINLTDWNTFVPTFTGPD